MVGILVAIFASVPEGVAEYSPHAPTSINGNADFTAANGVTSGSGTPSDPHVIEGWEIDLGFSGSVGIDVRNTDAAFLIRDVYVHADVFASEGIRLDNVTLGGLVDVIVEGHFLGNGALYIKESSGLQITNSSISAYEGLGIAVASSANFTLARNTLYAHWGGDIYIATSAGSPSETT